MTIKNTSRILVPVKISTGITSDKETELKSHGQAKKDESVHEHVNWKDQ